MSEWIDLLKRYFRFNKEERVNLTISTVILAFVISFREFSIGNFISALLIVAMSLLFHVSAQKAFALKKGYYVEYNLWWYGLLASLIIALLSNGTIWWVLLPGGVSFSMLARHRLGKFRYGLNYWFMGFTAFSGPIASIVLGTIFKNIELYIVHVPVPLFSQIFVLNLVLAVCTMLPIPPLDGHYLFYATRSWSVILFSTILVYTVLTAVFDVYSWIWAIIAGIIAWFVYYSRFEREAW